MISLALLPLLLATAASAMPVQVGGPKQLPTIPPDAPPAQFWGRNNPNSGYVENGYQQGTLTWDTPSKTVTIQWGTLPEPASAPVSLLPHLNFRPAFSDQTFRTRYYTTDVQPLGPGMLIVAGVMPANGNTVIEAWSFEWPQQLPVPITDMQTGEVATALMTPTRVSTRTLYSDDVSGKRIVRRLLPQRQLDSNGNETLGSVLVHFQDSRDMYSMNLATSQLALVASPSAPVGTLPAIPGLASDEYSNAQALRHVVYGYVYILDTGRMVMEDGGAPSLVLIDQDLDGVLEGVLEVAPENWSASPLSDWSSYIR